jgi:hypothetical protein
MPLPRNLSARHAVGLAALGLIITWSSWAHADTRTYIGGVGGDWNDSDNWVDRLQPSPSDLAFISGGRPLVTTLEVPGGLEVVDGAGIDIPGPGTLFVSGNALNNGDIRLGATGQGQMSVVGNSLDGDGEIVLLRNEFAMGGDEATLGGPAGPNPVAHAATHIIRGEGAIAGNWINNGVIRAEETSGDSSALLRLTGGSFTNGGLITSTPTGALLLTSVNVIAAPGGHFVADTVPAYILSATFTSGELEIANGGYYQMQPNSGLTLNGATVTGTINVTPSSGNSAVSSTTGGFTNNGMMAFDSVGAGTARLTPAAATVVSGNGQMIFRRDNAGITGFTTVTNGASHTMRGVGLFQPQGMVNEGSIIAEPQNGTVLLTITTGMTNNGLMQANDGAMLRLTNSPTQQGSTGRIRAASGGTVVLSDNIFVGGRLQTAGTGKIEISESQAWIQNIVNEGTLNIRATKLLNVLAGTITNDGVITVNSDNLPNVTVLEFDETATLDGTGAVVLNASGNFGAILQVGNGSAVITNGAGHTIRGNGSVGSSLNSPALINLGRLEGASAGQPLRVFGRLSGGGVLDDVSVQRTHAPGPGDGAGTTALVTLEGQYSLGASSRLEIDLAGTTPGVGYDQLSSAGAISLAAGSQLAVALAGGFTPSFGKSFTLLSTTGGISGAFGSDSVSLPAITPELAWIRTQTATELTIRTTWAADFDEDGDVDSADLVNWKAGFGGGLKTHLQGDADADGDADGADLLVWQRQLGNGSSSTATSANVPEPAGFLLLILAVTCYRRVCNGSPP